MSGYQFAHLDGYARKASAKGDGRSAQDIINEAERKPEACKHFDDPSTIRPPIIRYGVTPSQALEKAVEWAKQAKDPKGKKYRIDGHCIAAGVFSVPEDFPDDRWPVYRKAIIKHLKQKYGDRLLSVVEHTDETYRHCHFYLVPLPGESFGVVHQGWSAEKAAYARGERKGLQTQAYSDAMSAWQDEIHTISAPFGLLRTGPRRARLPNKEYKAAKRAASLIAEQVSTPPLSKPKLPPVEEIIDALEPLHSTGILGRGEPLYTRAQLLKASKKSALYGHKHAAQQQLDYLTQTTERAAEIDAAEARLKELRDKAEAQAAEIRAGEDKMKALRDEERKQTERLERLEQAVKEAHGYFDEAISRIQERALKALGGVLDAFVAIVEAPQDQELKDAARSGLESIGTSGAWAKLADRVVNVLMPSARAAQAADGIDWPEEVKEAGRKLRDRTVDSSSGLSM
ncbi:mobilization protein [Aeromonas veronii]